EEFLKGATMFKRNAALVLALVIGLTAIAASALGAWPNDSQSGTDEVPPQVKVAADLSDGSRVVGRAGELKELHLKAGFGDVRVPIELVETVQLKDDQGTAVIRFHNGDQLTGILNLKALGDLKVTTTLGETTVPLKLLVQCKVEGPPVRATVTARASST